MVSGSIWLEKKKLNQKTVMKTDLGVQGYDDGRFLNKKN
jgi:hypothetical protein